MNYVSESELWFMMKLKLKLSVSGSVFRVSGIKCFGLGFLKSRSGFSRIPIPNTENFVMSGSGFLQGTLYIIVIFTISREKFGLIIINITYSLKILNQDSKLWNNFGHILLRYALRLGRAFQSFQNAIKRPKINETTMIDGPTEG